MSVTSGVRDTTPAKNVVDSKLPGSSVLTQTVERRVYSGCGVDNEILARGGIYELLRSFIGGQSGVWSTVRNSFPGFIRH